MARLIDVPSYQLVLLLQRVDARERTRAARRARWRERLQRLRAALPFPCSQEVR